MKALAESVKIKFPNLVLEAYEDRGDAYVVIKKEGIRDIAHALKTGAEFAFNVLMDLSVVDYLFWEEKAARFEVIYNFYSTSTKRRLFVKALVPESDTSLDSVTALWPSADWLEREAFDMFGVRFKGHPDLKRILMYEGFEGHALRKDYPFNKRQPITGPVN